MSETPVPYYTGPSRNAPKPRKRRGRSVRYGPGRYAPAPTGRGFDCSVCLGGVRARARVADETAARAWIDATEAGLLSGRAPLCRSEMIDAQQARALLPGGVTLTEAAKAWLAANGSPAYGEPFGRTAAQYLDQRRGVLRPSTFSSYVQFLRRLGRAFPPDTPVGSVTPKNIEVAASGMTGRNRNNALRAWSVFFR